MTAVPAFLAPQQFSSRSNAMKNLIVLLCAIALSGGATASDEGVTPKEIRLGASVILTGLQASQTGDHGAGSRLYFDSVNEKGGVFGRKISYTTLDDGFDVQRAVENTRSLINEK